MDTMAMTTSSSSPSPPTTSRRRSASYLTPAGGEALSSQSHRDCRYSCYYYRHCCDMGMLQAAGGGGAPHSGPTMLALAAGTTLVALLGISSLSGLLDSSDDLEDEAQSEALEVAVIFCRVWMLSSAVVGVIAGRAVLQSHIPSLRIFALHAIIDTLLVALIVFIFALTAFSGSLSANLGHTVCEHLSRGDAWGLVASPGSGLELCEERWNYGLAPFLLLLGGIGLFVRTKTAIYIYDYYRNLESNQGKISLESPSVTSLHLSTTSSRSSDEGVRLASYDDHHHHHHRAQQYKDSQHPSHQSSHRSTSRPRNNTPSNTLSSSSSSPTRHSRSSSSSTVRPFRSATASRIMLLPVDYQSQQQQQPSLHITPPSPHLTHSNSSCESLDTVKGVSSTCQTNTANSSRKRAMSHDSGSNPYNHVVVYAPVLMSIEEAQQLGGKEAMIASSSSASSTTNSNSSVGLISASTSGMCTSPTHYPASPRLRNVSPPEDYHPHHHHHVPSTSHHRHQQHSEYPRDVKHKPKRSDSDSSNMTIVPDSSRTPVLGVTTTSPFGAIKGYRDSTEMEDLASAAKSA